MKTMEMIKVHIRDCAENEYCFSMDPDTPISELESIYYAQAGVKPDNGMLFADTAGQSIVHDKKQCIGTLVVGKVREVDLLFIPDTLNA